MDWSALARWEWLVIELVILAIAVRELISVKRELRRDRERDAQLAREKERDTAP
jgi:hypothetical protein